MTNWYSDKIATNGIHLHYTRTGGDKPPVVLVGPYMEAVNAFLAQAMKR